MIDRKNRSDCKYRKNCRYRKNYKYLKKRGRYFRYRKIEEKYRTLNKFDKSLMYDFRLNVTLQIEKVPVQLGTKNFRVKFAGCRCSLNRVRLRWSGSVR